MEDSDDPLLPHQASHRMPELQEIQTGRTEDPGNANHRHFGGSQAESVLPALEAKLNQLDWVGGAGGAPEQKFKDIRNQRTSVAEQKAHLCKRIGELCNKVPAKIANGSINITREWRATRDAAMKTAGSSRSSVNQLEQALNSMARWQ